MTARERATGCPALPAARRPCGKCPWRKDTPPGEFTAQRFRELAATSGTAGAEVMPWEPMFGCHLSASPAEPAPDVGCACAGWLARYGYEHLGVRIALSRGRLDPAVLEPQPGWPALWESYALMVAVMADSDVQVPGWAAPEAGDARVMHAAVAGRVSACRSVPLDVPGAVLLGDVDVDRRCSQRACVDTFRIGVALSQ